MARVVDGRDWRSLALVVAGIGGAATLAGALTFWPSITPCGTPVLVVLILPCLGALGFVSVWVREARYLAVILGALIGASVVGVMSFFWWGLVAAFMFGVALVIEASWKLRHIIFTCALALSTAAVSFVSLYQVATRAGVLQSQPQISELALATFPGFDYADAFAVELPAGVYADTDSIGRLFVQALCPCWSESISQTQLQRVALDSGSHVGAWAVMGRSTDEIVLGFNRSHIDLRLSLIIEQVEGRVTVTATTLAHYNNLVGRLYFVPVRFGHRIVLAESMRRLRKYASLPTLAQMEELTCRL